jgi:release factor glutamine methyltransferase
VIAALVGAGCLAPEAEADELLRAAGEGVAALDDLVARRANGEPLAWITGSSVFCGKRLQVDPGVFVPRPHTEALARRAVELLPWTGVGVDLCTGTGAIAAVMKAARPNATVLGTDVDPVAVACARRNDVDALLGHLDGPLPASLRGRVDVMTAVGPYVPTEELHLLPRDVLAHEPRRALDGGPGGTSLLARLAEASPGWLGPGGTVLLEIGGDQAGPIAAILSGVGLSEVRLHRDADGMDRAIEAARRRVAPGQKQRLTPEGRQTTKSDKSTVRVDARRRRSYRHGARRRETEGGVEARDARRSPEVPERS